MAVFDLNPISLDGSVQSRSDSLFDFADNDIYRFRVSSSGSIQLRLFGLSRDLDIRLFRDTNNDGVLTAADGDFFGNYAIASSTDGLLSESRRDYSLDDEIKLFQAATNGFYFAKVFAGTNNQTIDSSNSSYRLDAVQVLNAPTADITFSPKAIPSDTFFGISTFTASPVQTLQLFVPTNVQGGKVKFTFSNSDVNSLKLFRDSNQVGSAGPNGVFDSEDTLVNQVSNSNSLVENLNPGRYFLQLSGPGLANTTGRLDIAGTDLPITTPPSPPITPLTGLTDAIFRFRDKKGVYLFTSQVAEKNQVERDFGSGVNTFQRESESFNVSNTPKAGLLPVYRFFNNVTSGFFYTSDENERSVIKRTLSNQFIENDIAFYALPENSGVGTSVTRFFNPINGAHLFATSQNEINSIIAGGGFTNEGTKFGVGR